MNGDGGMLRAGEKIIHYEHLRYNHLRYKHLQILIIRISAILAPYRFYRNTVALPAEGRFAHLWKKNVGAEYFY